MLNDDLDDVLGEDEKPARVSKKAKKPSATKNGTAKEAKKPSKAKTTKPAKAAEKPKRKAAEDELPTQQPDDKVVLGALKKLKGPTPAAEFSNKLGIHRRTIRAQLRRLAGDKANGFKMGKDGHTVMIVPKA